MERAAPMVQLVERRGGVVTTSDLRKGGFSKHEIATAERTRLLRSVKRGVYVLTGKALTWEQNLLVATRATEPYGAVAALSAAALLRMDEFSRGKLQIVVPAKHQFEIEGVQVLRSRTFDPKSDTRCVEGLTVTNIPRTLLDLVPFCTEEQLIFGIEGLLRNHRARLRESVAYLRERARGRRDVLRLVQLIQDRLPRPATDDKWEVSAELLLNRAGIHPSRQNDIRWPNGRFIARPDIVFQDQKLIVEVDGRRTYGNPAAQERDRRRQENLVTVGYEVFRTSPRELRTDPDGFIARLRARLAERPRTPVPPMSPHPKQLELLDVA